MNNLFVTYSSKKADSGHIDPNFTQLIYGDSDKAGVTIKNNLKPGSFVFFNTNINGQRYITSYFYIEKILVKGINDQEIENLNVSAKEDEVIIIGSRLFSKVLTLPLLLNKGLLIDLKSFDVDNNYFKKKALDGYSELEAISHKTYNVRLLSDIDKAYLIELCRNRG